jgi:thymidylate synthase
MLILIANVCKYKNKLCIGINNDLLVNLKKDLQFFKEVTTENKTSNFNYVLMGNKTYDSLRGPLKNRYNLVLTRTRSPFKGIKKNNIGPYYLTLEDFLQFYLNKIHGRDRKVFIIGGSQIYNLFLNNFPVPMLYITEVNPPKHLKFNDSQLITMNHFNDNYKLISYSEKYIENEFSYRFLKYIYNGVGHGERNYLKMAEQILKNGTPRIDRTGVGTRSLFGTQLRFDLSNETIPLLTTRAVPIKGVIEELLFFCRGETDSKILEKKGVSIWKGNTTREFLDNRGLSHYPEGIMGPMYGWLWRSFGEFYDSNSPNDAVKRGFDQLTHVERLLREDPFSRRIYISNLNPADSYKMCLEPCHVYVQFYVEEIDGERYLSCYFTMRSSDYFLASVSFNTASYSILTHILALRTGMKAKEIVYNAVDTHIYNSHISQVKTQLTRTPSPFPKLAIDNSVKTKNWNEITFNDFDVIGYFPFPNIKAEMAI